MGRNMVRKVVGGDRLEELMHKMKADGTYKDQLIFLCIGTDRSSGDSLGPLTGTLLKERGYSNVIGTLERPCDADTWEQRVQELEVLKALGNHKVLAIDACLGQSASSVGLYQIGHGPLEAGRSVNRGFTPVGDYSIAAVVNMNRDHPLRVLETTSLALVWRMSHRIVAAVQAVFPAF